MPARTRSNREALLEGALSCLQDKGYARTTARDIVAASGTNLGAIGYHYGTTERLLNAAVIEGFERWFRELAQVVVEVDAASELERLTKIAAEVPRTFERNRPFALAFVEALAQSERSEEVRAALAESYEWTRQRAAELLAEVARPTELRGARVVASLLIAIFDGLLLQWIVDPARTPTGADLLSTLSLLAGAANDTAGL